MENTFTATAEVTINAPVAKVWEALTNPDLIKQYFFGTEVHTDWKVGSPITYTGSWEGKEYEDKGVILRVEPEKVLESTYWSSMSGEPDLPENYKKVTYELSSEGNQTTVKISNDNHATEEGRDHSAENWGMVLKGLKEFLEK